MLYVRRTIAKVGPVRALVWTAGAVATVVAAVAREWTGLILLVLGELVVVAWDNWVRLRESRRVNDKNELALENILDGLSKHSDFSFDRRVSSYSVRPNGDTEHDHTTTVDVTGEQPCRFIELGAEGDYLEERLRPKVDFAVTDSAGLPVTTVVRWSHHKEAQVSMSSASIFLVFAQPLAAGDTNEFRLRYRWPRQNPQLGQGDVCRFKFATSTPTRIWECSLLTRRPIWRALFMLGRGDVWLADTSGDQQPEVAQERKQGIPGGQRFTWTLTETNPGDTCVVRIQRSSD